MWRMWETSRDCTLVRGFIYCTGARESEQTANLRPQEWGRWWTCIALITHDGNKVIATYCPALAWSTGRPWCGHLDRVIVLLVDLCDVPKECWPHLTSTLYSPFKPGRWRKLPSSAASTGRASTRMTSSGGATSSWSVISGTNCTWVSVSKTQTTSEFEILSNISCGCSSAASVEDDLALGATAASMMPPGSSDDK